MKNLIDEFNKVLTNTLDYKEVLTNLAGSISHQATRDKLEEFAKVADKESEKLIKIISELGGDIETSARRTDQDAVCWVPKPLPDPSNMHSVLSSLVKAERNKEIAYNTLLAHNDISREIKNGLDKHRREAEANLKYFQTAMEAIPKNPM